VGDGGGELAGWRGSKVSIGDTQEQSL
jgi:hypothetical protein